MTEEQAENLIKALSTYIDSRIGIRHSYNPGTVSNVCRSRKDLKEALLPIPAADIKNFPDAWFVMSDQLNSRLSPGFLLLKP